MPRRKLCKYSRFNVTAVVYTTSRWVYEKAVGKQSGCTPARGSACTPAAALKALQGGCKGRATDPCSPLYMQPCQDGAMRGGCVASAEQARPELASARLAAAQFNLAWPGEPRRSNTRPRGDRVPISCQSRADLVQTPCRSRADLAPVLTTHASHLLPLQATHAHHLLPYSMPTTSYPIQATTSYPIQATTGRPRSRAGCTTAWRRGRSTCCSAHVSCRTRAAA